MWTAPTDFVISQKFVYICGGLSANHVTGILFSIDSKGWTSSFMILKTFPGLRTDPILWSSMGRSLVHIHVSIIQDCDPVSGVSNIVEFFEVLGNAHLDQARKVRTPGTQKQDRLIPVT